MRTRILLIAIAALVVGCGDGSPVSGPEPSTASTQPVLQATSITTATSTSISDAVDTWLNRLEGIETYDFHMVAGDGSTEEEMTGSFDAGQNAIRYQFEEEGFGSFEIVQADSTTYMRGELVSTLAGRQVEPDRWVEIVGYEEMVSSDRLWLHEVPVELAKAASTADLAAGRWRVEGEALEQFRSSRAGTVLAGGADAVEVSIEAESDSITYHLRSEGVDPVDMQVVIAPGSEVIEIPADPETIDLRASPEPETDTSIEPDDDGVLLDATRYGGQVDVRLSVEADGRVVLVTDRSVYATPGDFYFWRLDAAGVDRLVDAVEGSGLLGHPDANLQFGEAEGDGFAIGYNDGRVLSLHGPAQVPGLTSEEIEARTAFHELFERLTDHEWIESHVVESPGPYVPETLTVRLQPAQQTAEMEWPFPRSVADMETAPGVVCLAADDVGVLWDALEDGPLGNRYVSDGSGTWRMMIDAQTPGYVLYGDPCWDASDRTAAPGG